MECTGFATHIARGTGNEDTLVDETDKELIVEDISSADSAAGSRSCRLFFGLDPFPRPIYVDLEFSKIFKI